MVSENLYSAAEQALGYVYQIRFALLQTFKLNENTVCFIEKDDDIDFSDPEEGKILASLKHKAEGDSLTDLSPDFWKSVRIWLNYYQKEKKDFSKNHLSFFLFTTGKIPEGSVLKKFLPTSERSTDYANEMKTVLGKSESKTLNKIFELIDNVPDDDLNHFFSCITILDSQERIQDIPQRIINQRLRTVRPSFREKVYERLEGWWFDECIDLLAGKRNEPISVQEVSGKLSFIAEEYHADNLPIEFEFAKPDEDIFPESDERLFVKQLRAIGLKSDRIKRGILDYYRAFQQRNSWIREFADLNGELESYDDRLVDEWSRLKEIIFEELEEDSPEKVIQATARKLLNQISTSNRANFRIRPKVTATFVHMGSYHILANESSPRIFWHPHFEERVKEILDGVEK
ncbi:MAG TPA: ABC-three component system protein [Balneolaceae bacterium]